MRGVARDRDMICYAVRCVQVPAMPPDEDGSKYYGLESAVRASSVVGDPL